MCIRDSLTACATTKNDGLAKDGQSTSNDSRVIEVPNPVSLAQLVSRAPGVSLDFRRGIPKIRGGFPLYVVNGVRLGRNYYSAASSINVNNIKSVEVLKSQTETLIYGRDGANGVIVINTL